MVCLRHRAELLPTLRKILFNQSINRSFKPGFIFFQAVANQGITESPVLQSVLRIVRRVTVTSPREPVWVVSLDSQGLNVTQARDIALFKTMSFRTYSLFPFFFKWNVHFCDLSIAVKYGIKHQNIVIRVKVILAIWTTLPMVNNFNYHSLFY